MSDQTLQNVNIPTWSYIHRQLDGDYELFYDHPSKKIMCTKDGKQYFPVNGIPAELKKALLEKNNQHFTAKIFKNFYFLKQCGAMQALPCGRGGWDNDIHDGRWNSDNYKGTYQWAKDVLSILAEEQEASVNIESAANAIANECNHIDDFKLKDRTDPVFDQGRHFNVTLSANQKVVAGGQWKQGEWDSRLQFAKKHFSKAIVIAETNPLAHLTPYEELGQGLHSVQDVFAHDDSYVSIEELSLIPKWILGKENIYTHLNEIGKYADDPRHIKAGYYRGTSLVPNLGIATIDQGGQPGQKLSARYYDTEAATYIYLSLFHIAIAETQQQIREVIRKLNHLLQDTSIVGPRMLGFLEAFKEIDGINFKVLLDYIFNPSVIGPINIQFNSIYLKTNSTLQLIALRKQDLNTISCIRKIIDERTLVEKIKQSFFINTLPDTIKQLPNHKTLIKKYSEIQNRTISIVTPIIPIEQISEFNKELDQFCRLEQVQILFMSHYGNTMPQNNQSPSEILKETTLEKWKEIYSAIHNKHVEIALKRLSQENKIKALKLMQHVDVCVQDNDNSNENYIKSIIAVDKLFKLLLLSPAIHLNKEHSKLFMIAGQYVALRYSADVAEYPFLELTTDRDEAIRAGKFWLAPVSNKIDPGATNKTAWLCCYHPSKEEILYIQCGQDKKGHPLLVASSIPPKFNWVITTNGKQEIEFRCYSSNEYVWSVLNNKLRYQTAEQPLHNIIFEEIGQTHEFLIEQKNKWRHIMISPKELQDNIQAAESIAKYRKNALVESLREVIPEIYKARGKEITLVIGNTGSGKSTLINSVLLWQHGLSYAKDRRNLRLPTDLPPGLKLAFTGNESTSKTKYPTIYGDLCDCQGFGDTDEKKASLTREQKEIAKVIPIMSLKLLAKIAKIKGLIVVVSANALYAADEGRATSFKDLSLILSSLFANPGSPELLKSLVTVISHPPYGEDPEYNVVTVAEDISKILSAKDEELGELLPKKNLITAFFGKMIDTVKNTVKELFKDKEEKMTGMIVSMLDGEELTEEPTSNEHKTWHQGLDEETQNKIQNIAKEQLLLYGLKGLALSKKPCRTIISDPIRNSNSYKDAEKPACMLMNVVKRLPLLDPKEFSFAGETTKGQRGIESVIDTFINEFDAAMQETIKLHANIQAKKALLAQKNKEILKNQQSLANWDTIDRKALLESKQAKLTALLEIEKEKLTNIDTEIETITAKKMALDQGVPTVNKKPFPYITDSVREDHCWPNWTKKKLEYNGMTNEVPYDYVIETASNLDRWEDKKAPSNKLYYSNTYVSTCGSTGIASLEVYVQTRNKPGNPEKIKSFTEQLAKANNKKECFEIQKNSLEKDLELCKKDLELCKRDILLLNGKITDNEEEVKKVARKEIEGELLAAKNIVAELPDNIDLLEKKLKLEYLRPLLQDQDLFDMVSDLIVTILPSGNEEFRANHEMICSLWKKYGLNAEQPQVLLDTPPQPIVHSPVLANSSSSISGNGSISSFSNPSTTTTSPMILNQFNGAQILPFQNDTHWYTDAEISSLMGHSFDRHESVEIITAIDAYSNGGKTLAANLHDNILNQEMIASFTQSNSPINTIIAPINLGNTHWTALYIRFNSADRTKPLVYYIDPIEDPKRALIPEELIKALTMVFNISQADIRTSPIKLQQDCYNCGPWVMAILRELVASNGERLPLPTFNIIASRRADMEILGDMPVNGAGLQLKI